MMQKSKLMISSCLLLFIGGLINAQQNAHYTQYTYNMALLNPAYTATNEMVNARLLARSQWVGIEGAPTTVTFTLSAPVGKSLAMGISVIHDEVGPVKENNLNANFSYTLRLSANDHRLAFGLKAGYSLLDVAGLDPIDLIDPLNTPINTGSPNMGFGAFYFTNSFYLGLSVPSILSNRRLEKGKGQVSTVTRENHYFLTSGMIFDLSDTVRFKPSAMLNISGPTASIDLSANLLVNDLIETGLSYRIDDAISAVLALHVDKNFRIGYAYDYSLHPFSDYSSGSHEIMLIYSFSRKKNVMSPRFF